MTRFFGCVFAGLAAYWLARGVGIPHWREWPPGDAVDIGLAVVLAASLLTARAA